MFAMRDETPTKFRLYYCTKCGFAKIFPDQCRHFNECPACGNEVYVESSLSPDETNSNQKKRKINSSDINRKYKFD